MSAMAFRVLRGTFHECWNVARAKMGHDPHGMLMKDRPWPEVIRHTYRAHWLVEHGQPWP